MIPTSDFARAAPESPKPVWGSLTAAAIVSGYGLMSILVMLAINLVVALAPEASEALQPLLSAQITPTAFIASVTSSSLIFATVALGAAWLGKEPLRSRLRLHMGRATAGRIIAGCVGVIALAFALDGILGFVASTLNFSSLKLMSGVVARASGASFAGILLTGALGAGVAEELFFRGFIQSRCSLRWGRWVAITITSVSFGLAHGDILHTPFALVVGLYIGYLAEHFGGIVPGMMAHILNNLVAFGFARLVRVEATTGMSAIFATCGFAIAILCILYVRRPSST